MTKLDGSFAKGIEALEAENLDGVRAAISAMDGAGGVDDLRRRYLAFMSVWLDEDATEELFEGAMADADALLEGGAGLTRGEDAARVVLDVADILMNFGEIEEPDHALRQLCERDDLGAVPASEARLLRAQVALDHFEDPEEALSLLDEADPSFHTDLGYVSLRAGVLGELEREDEAIDLLERNVAASEDIELRYQLGLMLDARGRSEQAVEHLLTVRRADLVTHGVDADQAVDPDESRDLKRRLEELLETLPDPVIKRLGRASIRVERWSSEDAVKGGADPRNGLRFEGKPDSEEADDGHVDAVVIHRDAIVAMIDDDDEILDVLTVGLVVEFDRFFGLELIPGV